jgi:hypothetical protein
LQKTLAYTEIRPVGVAQQKRGDYKAMADEKEVVLHLTEEQKKALKVKIHLTEDQKKEIEKATGHRPDSIEVPTKVAEAKVQSGHGPVLVCW